MICLQFYLNVMTIVIKLYTQYAVLLRPLLIITLSEFLLCYLTVLHNYALYYIFTM